MENNLRVQRQRNRLQGELETVFEGVQMLKVEMTHMGQKSAKVHKRVLVPKGGTYINYDERNDRDNITAVFDVNGERYTLIMRKGEI